MPSMPQVTTVPSQGVARCGEGQVHVGPGMPGMPVMPGPVDAEAESGRGLVLVEAMSKEWGVRSLSSGGKVVYAVIDAPVRVGGQ
jgi:hypothetical protein